MPIRRESFSIVLPYEFIAERVELTWRELLWGLESSLLPRCAVGDHAREVLARTEQVTPDLVDAAWLSKGDPVHPLVDQLADSEAVQPESELRAKWLYLLLEWVFLERDKFEDPMDQVAQIHADFGYPKEINGFVHYLPQPGPPPVSAQQGKERIFRNWEKYLERCRAQYSRR